ncbi:hypothetical protein [Hymenobacter cellulosilyticus]|uniref:PorT family protein n=1 Tax=Hymenobacter cellulosilyticus TaxID=2932248 RepID=A0A8T9Q3B6_9BACT|nr:hypothetical protein [Hymenobacter cellulosilyticus]UOQ71957.1 hypothetical protein MUN79_25740 [Hymenobacter cellulosilyticus]
MKKFTLFFLGALAAHFSYGQRTEFSIHLNSGAAAYRGAAASSNSTIIMPTLGAGTGPYTTNAYGRRPAFSYGLAGQWQRLTGGQNLLGVQAGYDVLRSRVQITSVLDRNSNVIQTDGHTTLTNNFINVHPFFGHRFELGSVALDLTAGPEAGYLLHSEERGEAVSGKGVSYTTKRGHAHPDVDVRGRLNLTAYYKEVGLSLGYSYGLTNYGGDVAGEANEVYSQAFRAGLSFRLTK